MSALEKAAYRSFQAVFNVGARLLPWRRPIVVSGVGSAARIPELLRNERVARVLVVSGPTVAARLLPPILQKLDEAGIAYSLFDRVEANPSTDTVEAIRALYEAERCEGFLAVGGGSPIDACKAAAARVARPHASLAQMAGLLKVLRELPPFIAVPTTAGTGSETTIAAVVTDRATHHKYALMDLNLVPKYAVLDPALTAGLPPKITAGRSFPYSSVGTAAVRKPAISSRFRTISVIFRTFSSPWAAFGKECRRIRSASKVSSSPPNEKHTSRENTFSRQMSSSPRSSASGFSRARGTEFARMMLTPRHSFPDCTRIKSATVRSS